VALVRVYFVQDKREIQLGEAKGTTIPAVAFWRKSHEKLTLHYKVGKQTLPDIKEGKASIVVYAQPASTWLNQPAASTKVLSLPVLLTPPRIELLSRGHFVTQGGAGVVRYRVGPSAVKHGVQMGDWWFPGFPLPSGTKGECFAFYGAAYDLEAGEIALLKAEDLVGNESTQSFVDNLAPKVSKRDTIRVSDRFMSIVVPRIKSKTPNMPSEGRLVDQYVWINRELRKQNDEKIRMLARTSTPAFVWKSHFVQMSAKVFSSFADHRSYRYEGQEIDQQYHLGYDLASVKRAPIPAANRGRIVLNEYLGIYGNTVVLDHGFGLMTLYGHLSRSDVKVGEWVQRGSIIGATGATGLALGDHLHFAVLVHGLAVRPLEWWDSKWVQNRIIATLGPSFSDTAD
jgi:murein DD-endopeptidase MepM/ murein hydrolase activator NlpD